MSLQNLQASLEAHFLAAADKASLAMERKAVELAPDGASSPGLKSQIHGQGIQEGMTVKARLVCTSPYGPYIENGTGPAVGHDQYMPPPGALRQYLQRKLGVSGDELDKAEAAVRWKIYMKGTKPQPFMKPAYDSVAPKWKGLLKQAARDAIREALHG